MELTIFIHMIHIISSSCSHDVPKVPNKILPRNPPSCLFVSCFTVSLPSSFNKPEFSSDFMMLMLSSISSFKMTKVNLSLLLWLLIHDFFGQYHLLQKLIPQQLMVLVHFWPKKQQLLSVDWQSCLTKHLEILLIKLL